MTSKQANIGIVCCILCIVGVIFLEVAAVSNAQTRPPSRPPPQHTWFETTDGTFFCLNHIIAFGHSDQVEGLKTPGRMAITLSSGDNFRFEDPDETNYKALKRAIFDTWKNYP